MSHTIGLADHCISFDNDERHYLVYLCEKTAVYRLRQELRSLTNAGEIGLFRVDPKRHQRQFRAEWIDMGEGLSGEYIPEDEGDVHLLRLDIYSWDDQIEEWVGPDGYTHCTLTPADTPVEQLLDLLRIVLHELLVGDDENLRLTCQSLSHIEPDWLDKHDVNSYDLLYDAE